jgi:hypothetical protein
MYPNVSLFYGEPFLKIDAKGGEILGESVRGKDTL